MNIGDILELEPTMEGTSGLGTSGPQPCTVIWVHPAKRFFCGGISERNHRRDLAGGRLVPAEAA